MSRTHAFTAQSSELLHMMIHSVYSNKEVFLRELLSNASDALDKLRFALTTDPHLVETGYTPQILLKTDPDARTLEVSDNGIGMSEQEMIEYLGTIAKSGTKDLLQTAQSADTDFDPIGQFGVGFYSVFMVADKVRVVSKKAGEEQGTCWESTGEGVYTTELVQWDTAGTSITLHLKPSDEEHGLLDFCDEMQLRRLVKRYSDFLAYPILLNEDTDALNSMKPIWKKNLSEVSAEELSEFYRHISHDFRDPLHSIQYKAEGTMEFEALLFIPEQAPLDFEMTERGAGLRLYVNRVLIQENFEGMLPHYLRFVRGVVDCRDFPLNVSREVLQQDRLVSRIAKTLTKKVVDELTHLKSEDKEKYLTFYQVFHLGLKEGVSMDLEMRERLSALLMYQTSLSEFYEDLDTVMERMPSEQDCFYYATGDSIAQINALPQMEGFLKDGVEVLYMTMPQDELMLHYFSEYKGKKIRSIADANLPSDPAKDAEIEERSSEAEDLLKSLQECLTDAVKEVRLSKRLQHAPACLVLEANQVSPHLEKVLRHSPQAGAMDTRRILELNADHVIFRSLEAQYAQDPSSVNLQDTAHLLLGYTLLAEGADLRYPQEFNTALLRLLEHV